jgi:cytochrome-b5 reductase
MTQGLPIGQHISFMVKTIGEDGKEKQEIRSYTPTTSDDELGNWHQLNKQSTSTNLSMTLGYVDFVIKVYSPNERFLKGGFMSQYLDRMEIGDFMNMKGPKGHMTYMGKGNFTIAKTVKGSKVVREYKKKRIGMVAGGTGITPMLQVIRQILKDPEDKTEIWLLFANQTEDDILLRNELEAIPKDRFHLWYTLDRPPTCGWNYSSGFVNLEMCRDHLPSQSEDTM